MLMNNTAVNIHAQVFVCMYVFNSLECMPRSGLSGLTVTLCLTFWGIRPSGLQLLVCVLPSVRVLSGPQLDGGGFFTVFQSSCTIYAATRRSCFHIVTDRCEYLILFLLLFL